MENNDWSRLFLARRKKFSKEREQKKFSHETYFGKNIFGCIYDKTPQFFATVNGFSCSDTLSICVRGGDDTQR